MEPGAATPMPAFAGPRSLHPVAAVSLGWGTFRKNLGPALLFALVMFVCMVVGEFIPFLNFVFFLLVMPVLIAGGAHYLVRQVRGGSPEISSVFDGFRRWPTVAGAMLIQMIVTFALLAPVLGVAIAVFGAQMFLHPETISSHGPPSPALFLPMFMLFPVCYVAMAWWYARTWPLAFLVMEPGCPGAMVAFKATWAMTRGNTWRSIGLFLLAVPLEILGLLALCVGIVPAILTMYYAIAHGYEMLRGASPAGGSPAGEPAPEPGIVL